MTLREVYARYKIMPNLQLHQLRVASVGKTVCDHFRGTIDMNVVVTACLLHDMGNILKFDLGRFPEFLEPDGLAHWQGVKAEYEVKYGRDQHQATLAICRELGMSEAVLECVDSVAFSKAETTLEKGSWEQRVCEYADSRVSPYGVRTLEERLHEARVRYSARAEDIGVVPAGRYEELLEAEREMERRIFAQCDIVPSDITEESIASVVGELWEYPLS